MKVWNPALYMKFGQERTQPSLDLVARIPMQAPNRVMDLGCGPGNSTQVLRDRWPEARVTGLDHSEEMITTARHTYPDQEWLQQDLATWKASEPVDVVFSNAALQWVPGHEELIPCLLRQARAGGILAFQVPSGRFAAVRRHIQEIAADPAWTERMHDARNALTMHEPGFYHDLLAEHTESLALWETEYVHEMTDHQAIVDWISGTGLSPFLRALDQEVEKVQFRERLLARVREDYPLQKNGKVLFPFRRLFLVATRR